MNSRIINLTFALAGLSIGFFIGRSVGYSARSDEQRLKSHSELVSELRRKEFLQIQDFVDVSSSWQTVDEGGLFKKKLVTYLSGKVVNNALATGAMDVKLRVDYLSTTSAVISSEEITIYDRISPLSTKTFKEKINLPPKTNELKFALVDVKPD